LKVFQQAVREQVVDSHNFKFAEDEPQDEADKDNEDDHPINPLVDALFDEVESLRFQVRLASTLNLCPDSVFVAV
jgi:hypothetical protein